MNIGIAGLLDCWIAGYARISMSSMHFLGILHNGTKVVDTFDGPTLWADP